MFCWSQFGLVLTGRPHAAAQEREKKSEEKPVSRFCFVFVVFCFVLLCFASFQLSLFCPCIVGGAKARALPSQAILADSRRGAPKGCENGWARSISSCWEFGGGGMRLHAYFRLCSRTW